MTRYIWPALMFAATGYVWQYNTTHDSSKLVLPFFDVLMPSLAGDPAALGERTWQVALGLSIGLLLWEIALHIRAIGRRRAAAETDEG